MSDYEWPREIWAGEPEEYDVALTCVFSEMATVARYIGDTERERAFHKYVDADVLDSQERYYKHQLEQARALTAHTLRQTLSIMLNLDQSDLVSAGVLDADDQRGWEKFRNGPHRAALSLPQERMERLAGIIDERMKK